MSDLILRDQEIVVTLSRQSLRFLKRADCLDTVETIVVVILLSGV